VAFLKFSRDKRGYENFYLVQPTARGSSRPRLLYWFHTPPNVKVGRRPFDTDVRRALEAQNPEVTFDWTTIVQTPIPAPDTEKWRERRRVERAIRAASEIDSLAEAEAVGAQAASAVAADADEFATAATALAPAAVNACPDIDATIDDSAASNTPATAPDAGAPTHRRRRRRRGRRKGPATGTEVPSSASELSGPDGQSASDAAEVQVEDSASGAVNAAGRANNSETPPEGTDKS
jgi:hypothetical protein